MRVSFIISLLGLIVGCSRPQHTEFLPSHQAPVYYERAVSSGTISIETSLRGGSGNVPKAAILHVCFVDANGSLIHAPGLVYSKSMGCDYEYIEVGPKQQKYKKVLEVPNGAVAVRVAITRWHHNKEIVAKPLKLSFVPMPVVSKWRMQIVSVWFLLFVLLSIFLYFLLPGKMRPWILLLSSVAFYSCFNKYAFFFIGGSALSIWIGGLLQRGRDPTLKKLILASVLILNICVLLTTKYLVLAVEGVCDLFDLNSPTLSIVMPLGISFYTLQAVSYMMDVYRGIIPAERNPFRLALYLIFFPTVMQGPISRYGQLGPQLWTPHKFACERMHSGLALVLWGFFKKMVIADRAAMLADVVFAPGSSIEGFATILGVLCYSIQIYADFSGCVDICRGVSEMLGIDLIQNFKHPYFATSIKDFWRRWHISLSSWLKDYVYIPLGGNRHGEVRKYINVLIVFGVSGIWHGTGLNYFIWGLLHGFYQVFDGMTARIRGKTLDFCKVDQTTFSFKLGQRIGTFVLVAFAWIFFRAQSFADACSVIKRMFVWNPWTWTDGSYLKHGLDAKDFDVLFVSLIVLLVVSMLQEKGSVRLMLRRQTLWFRWMIYIFGIFMTLIFGVYGPGYNEAGFIYMQF